METTCKLRFCFCKLLDRKNKKLMKTRMVEIKEQYRWSS